MTTSRWVYPEKLTTTVKLRSPEHVIHSGYITWMHPVYSLTYAPRRTIPYVPVLSAEDLRKELKEILAKKYADRAIILPAQSNFSVTII